MKKLTLLDVLHYYAGCPCRMEGGIHDGKAGIIESMDNKKFITLIIGTKEKEEYHRHKGYYNISIGSFKPIMRSLNSLTDKDVVEFIKEYYEKYTDVKLVSVDEKGFRISADITIGDCRGSCSEYFHFYKRELSHWLIKNHFNVFELTEDEIIIQKS